VRRYSLPVCLAILLILLLLPGVSAFFISPRVSINPGSSQTTYFIGEYVSNETLVYPDKIFLDRIFVVLEPDTGRINSSIQGLTSENQRFHVSNETPDTNVSLNTSGWNATVLVIVYSNSSVTAVAVANSSGWVNWLYQNLTWDTTELLLSTTGFNPVITWVDVFPNYTVQMQEINCSILAENDVYPGFTVTFEWEKTNGSGTWNMTEFYGSALCRNNTVCYSNTSIPANATAQNDTWGCNVSFALGAESYAESGFEYIYYFIAPLLIGMLLLSTAGASGWSIKMVMTRRLPGVQVFMKWLVIVHRRRRKAYKQDYT